MRFPALLGAVLVLSGCRSGAGDGAGLAHIPRPLGPGFGATPTPVGPPTAISLENALPGGDGWRLRTFAGPGELEGYADPISVAAGEPVTIHLRANGDHQVRWELWRMGWYGGLLGRELASGGALPVADEATPSPDPSTGLMECAWPTTFTLTPDPSWVSGVYLVKLTREDGKESYVVFLLHDDSPHLARVEIPVLTWEAYNPWGGESLYDSAMGLSFGHAKEVSFRRPFAQGQGSGQLFRYDLFLIAWVESKGYDLSYTSGIDLDASGVPAGTKLVLSSGHDEYWSRPERAAVESARDAGIDLAFLGSNDLYWQVRLEASRLDPSAARRTEVGWKEAADCCDPDRGTPLATTKWRDPVLNEPENALIGVMYDNYQLIDLPWVVMNAGSWLYAGTGVSEGDTLPLVVGYETDRRWDNGFEPSGLEPLAHSPMLTYGGLADWHDAGTYDTPAGGFVVGMGSIELAWGLSHPGVADTRVQTMVGNLFTRAGVPAATAGASFGAGAGPTIIQASAGAKVSTLAGAAFQEGLVDGSLATARFKRPTAAVLNGDLFLTDTGNGAIRRIDLATGSVTTFASGLSVPIGIAAHPDGSLWVADSGAESVVRIGSDGSWSTVAGGFDAPTGLAIVNGKVYVSDTRRHCIVRVSPGGGKTAVAGSASALGFADGPLRTARLRFPTMLAADGNGILVTDSGNRLLRRIDLAAGTMTTLAGTPPTAYADGQPAGGFADGPISSALLMSQGTAVDLAGTLYLADTGNSRIRALAGGTLATLAGSGSAGWADGAAAQARFSLPTAVIALPDGRLLVVDEGSSTLRIVDRGP